MDPCHFLRIVISNLSLRTTRTQAQTQAHSYYAKLTFLDFPPQYSPIPTTDPGPNPTPAHSISACFTLTRPDLARIKKQPPSSSSSPTTAARRPPTLKIDVFSTGSGKPTCGFRFGFGSGSRVVGRVVVPVEVGQQVMEGKTSSVIQNGWVVVGKKDKKRRKGEETEVYVNVKAQPEPRFVFEFEGEPEFSPQVVQVQGNIRQPVFSCKFGSRNSGDCSLRSSSSMSEASTSRSWLTSLKSDKDQSHHHHHHHLLNNQPKERKGWSLTVHDLSGSPVAIASMVTPFVPSQGSDRVSRSNPGAWLILRPGDGTWKPWGRLEAWRDRAGLSGPDGLGYKFELLPDAGPSSVMGPTGITLAQSSIPTRAGGKFIIDNTTGTSPVGSPHSSFDFASWSGSGSTGSSISEVGSGSGWCPGFMYKGFVMSSTVGGEVKGKGKGKKAVVEVGAQHVTCTEDAAVFVALAAAIDLSMDACRPFSQKLRKELSGEVVV